MILRRLRARNFMRYQELTLEDLPAEGAIAIIGENESGKTTIGEAISFALFGETVKSRATDISQVISWDQEEAEVELELDAGKRGILAVRRRADKRGGHDATLLRGADAGAAAGSKTQEAVASGPDAVSKAVRELFGLGFDEFRASFYLAQAELGLVRRSDAEGDGRKVVREIVGIATLDRAAARARKDLADRRARADALNRDLVVSRALAEAHEVAPGYGEDLEREGAEMEAAKADCAARLPELSARIQKLGEAETARADALAAFERLSRAIVFSRAERAAAAAKGELGAVQRGLESEANKLRRDLHHREKTLAEVRSRVDRLIDYQAKIAELEARLDLYKLEVKRALDAPDIDAEDIEELEGLALPATPAGGLKLSQARVVRLKRARTKAITRAAIFLAVAVIAALIGVPGFANVRPAGVPETPDTGWLDGALRRGVRLVAERGTELEQTVWLTLAVTGCGLAVLFLSLSISRVKRFFQRADQVKLARDAVQRLEAEVKELEAERVRLDALDLKHPLKFAEAVKEIKNKTVEEQFARIRERHNDFILSPEQRDALVAKERAEEGRLRDEAQAVDGRLARVVRLEKVIEGSGTGTGTGTDEEAIPEKLEAVEARVKSLMDRLDEAERDRRDVERGGPTGEPLAFFREVQQPLERAWRAVSADALRAQLLSQTKLAKLAGAPGDFGGQELRQALEGEAKLLDGSLPKAQELRAERERIEDERKSLEARHATAAARLMGLSARLAEIRDRKGRFAEADERARRLGQEREAVLREVEVGELSAEMLEETARDLERRLGPMLARYAAAVLPRLTGGRYRRVKVQPDLELRVYSPEKNDYVPLVDLSIGAADQLLLALRLAVGRALVSAKGLGEEKHFLFLDEPLASFDESRARAFLEILRDHRDTFPQVFVVAHLHIHGLEDGFARIVTPKLDSRTLVEGPRRDDLLELAGDVVEEEEEAETP